MKASKQMLRGLFLGGAILSLSPAAPAASVVNSFHYTFRAALTNAGLDPDARGTVSGNVNRRGSVDNQRLGIISSKLDPDATYQVVAATGEGGGVLEVTNFVANGGGGSTLNYLKTSGRPRNALPAVLDPVSNIRELNILDANGAPVLLGDLLAPRTFSYSVKREMENTGLVTDAAGVLQVRGTPRSTKVSLTASGLAPSTSYQLLVNEVSVTTGTSDARGKLKIVGPRTGLPLVLDITTVALADEGGSLVLVTTGLGIPGSLSTSKGTVNLGAAANFAVLAGSTVTSINATAIDGDLGLSPGTDVTGFPPGTVTGDIHAGNDAAALAQASLTIAYNDVAGRTLAPVTVAGNLGGQTLAPGLYKSTGSLEISSGDLTLDAQGNANAVFLFQIASTLTTTSGRQVILTGGAKASNVFWQVGTSATLGTTTIFKGTIMADQSITLNNGATLDGRALARIGAVSMDANAITLP